MALFSDDDKKKDPSEEMQKGLAQLGGLGAGALIGKATTFPIDSRYQGKLLAQSIENTRMQEHSENRWRTLFKLYDGDIRLEDLPPGDREIYTKLLEENKDELNHLSHRPDLKRQVLADMKNGKVTPLYGETKVPMTKPFPYKVSNPASKGIVGLASIGGGIAGGAIYDHYKKSDNHRKTFERNFPADLLLFR